MSQPISAKKNQQILVRLSDELDRRFVRACEQSDISPQDALRRAAQAMVIAHEKFGRIPSDMEIRQAQIGDMTDIFSLLDRVRAVAEEQAVYETARKLPITRPAASSTPKKLGQ